MNSNPQQGQTLHYRPPTDQRSMKRREWVAVQIRAALANGGPISGATLVEWARTLDEHGPYSGSDDRYNDETYARSTS